MTRRSGRWWRRQLHPLPTTRSSPTSPEQIPHDCAVIEGCRNPTHGLSGLVSLAGNQECIAIPKRPKGTADGLEPVADLGRVRRPLQYLGTNRRWILGSRVIVRHRYVVRVPGSDLAHQPAFA